MLSCTLRFFVLYEFFNIKRTRFLYKWHCESCLLIICLSNQKGAEYFEQFMESYYFFNIRFLVLICFLRIKIQCTQFNAIGLKLKVHWAAVGFTISRFFSLHRLVRIVCDGTSGTVQIKYLNFYFTFFWFTNLNLFDKRWHI